MSPLHACPQCMLENTYPDRDLLVCADCGFEWMPGTGGDAAPASGEAQVRDAHGAVLANGDSAVLIKDLKVKGSSTTLKMGTKIKGIRLVEGDHEVDCRTEAGSFMLKACYLKKV